MEIPAKPLTIASFALHVVSVVVIASTWVRFPIFIPWDIAPAALIGIASFTTVKRRPIPMFVAFGLLTAVAFWFTIGALRVQSVLSALPPLLLITGIAWMLQAPNWPSALFTLVAGLMFLGVLWLTYRFRFENDYSTPEVVAQMVISTSILVVLGLLQAGVGFAMFLVQPKPKKKKSVTRQIVVPTE